jgi:hypothetical protein
VSLGFGNHPRDEAVEERRLLRFREHYVDAAKPFQWPFTRRDLTACLRSSVVEARGQRHMMCGGRASGGGGGFVLDNIALETLPSAVPGPFPLVLLGIGSLGLLA